MPWDALVPMLDVLRWEQPDTLLRRPASNTAIADAKERLGAVLPADYKQFLLVFNGIEFMPSVDAPGFKPVEEVRWLTAEELGLDGSRVDKLVDLLPDEWVLEDEWTTKKANIRDALAHVTGMPR